MTGKGHRALVEISGGYTNIICEERDGERLAGQAVPNAAAAYQELHVLTLEDIYDYAKKRRWKS